VRQFAQGWFVEVVKVGVGQEDEIDGRQVFDAQAGAFDAFEEEEPVGEIGVNQDVQVGELDQKRGMADPGEGDLAAVEFWKLGLFMLAGARGEKGLPDHFAEKSAWIEGFGGGEIFKGLGQGLANPRRTRWFNGQFRHNLLTSLQILQDE